jgi:hypothetical protein
VARRRELVEVGRELDGLIEAALTCQGCRRVQAHVMA